MAEFKTIGIITKSGDPTIPAVLRQLRTQLTRLGVEAVFDESAAEYVDSAKLSLLPRDQLGKRCDLIIVIGGDGTLLQAGRAVARHGVPILGVNRGRLGFMVDVNPDEMPQTLETVLRGNYVAENRLMLSATVHSGGRKRGPFLAINDVVVRNLVAVRMLEVETWLGDQFISLHRADGLIVSSPTGSTAYALSGGGPVLHPGLDALALVPICPHTLSDRPIVVGSGLPVRLVLCGSEGTRAICTCDGQVNEEIVPGDTVEVRRSRHVLRLIHPPNHDYFHILRNKLQWGRGPNRKPA